MSALPLVTLLTDFGTQDVYVAVMKGAIASLNPQLAIVDLTHHIPPQDRFAARFQLMNAVPYFPAGTVHVAVVDPGVGTARRGVAIAIAPGFLVGPDNGLFSGVLEQFEAIAAVELTEPTYWRVPQPSSTFHGRDIFAPVGAHLASGVPLNALGRAIDLGSLVELPGLGCDREGDTYVGCIQAIDRFGNAISTIPGEVVRGRQWLAIAAGTAIPVVTTYGDVAVGELAALAGSHGWVEIAVNGGNARDRLRLDYGVKVEVKLENKLGV
ncbi:S-adenosyl-l-methionine hydroxide adenosyltransferase family protein [Synechococcus sp. PCC 7336]|uniref:SAM hydrolase/SAM-dependent halogenase family protein n=1 Tax=Synechococcus sp. PCC 7336 TaxID=195250 RepID=UPI000345A70F|nr:SAM-dependent chlorinase/fluorinase [Synechococcus sp. PCC 7336]